MEKVSRGEQSDGLRYYLITGKMKRHLNGLTSKAHWRM